MAKYNDPISGKTVEATNAEEAKKIIEDESKARLLSLQLQNLSLLVRLRRKNNGILKAKSKPK